MSKIPVKLNENIFEKQILCPHNKIAAKVEKVYRVEKPVRLREVSHLRKIGQCECPICSNNNKLLCECSWKKKEKLLLKQMLNEEKNKDEPIFKHQTIPPPADDDEYPLRIAHGVTACGALFHNLGRSTLIEKFRQSYRKSRNYLSGRKSNESFSWIMKPIAEFRKSRVDVTQLRIGSKDRSERRVNRESNATPSECGRYKNPVDKSSSSNLSEESNKTYKSLVNEELNCQKPQMCSLEGLKNSTNHYIRSVAGSYPAEMLAGDSQHSLNIEPVESAKTPTKAKTRNLPLPHKDSFTTIEVYNDQIGLEQMQYKSSEQQSTEEKGGGNRNEDRYTDGEKDESKRQNKKSKFSTKSNISVASIIALPVDSMIKKNSITSLNPSYDSKIDLNSLHFLGRKNSNFRIIDMTKEHEDNPSVMQSGTPIHLKNACTAFSHKKEAYIIEYMKKGDCVSFHKPLRNQKTKENKLKKKGTSTHKGSSKK